MIYSKEFFQQSCFI